MVNHPNRKRASRIATASAVPVHDHDAEYSALRAVIQPSLDAALADGNRLFTTDTEGLFDLYLNTLPTERQVHNCTACRRFFKDYGGLVAIAPDGSMVPAFWNATPPDFYTTAWKTLHDAVRKARVTGPFLSTHPVWGIPQTGEWSHFAAKPPASMLFRHSLLTAGQAMAAKREDFRTVASALSDFTPVMLGEALRLLETASLRSSEKFVGPVKWLASLQEARGATRNARVKDNLLWRAIAAAPDGYCHPRSSVVGSLLEDIAAGMAFDDVKARFNAKMHPLMYQRPQAAPSAGSIAVAEKIVEQMGIAPAFERRFARLDDLETAWLPKARAKPAGGGVFGHLTPKNETPPIALSIPPAVMTWDKFSRTVLSTAEAMRLNVPSHGAFIALTTAVHADAPPILKWDREDRRNPVAWYVYHNGSSASQWRLAPGWCEVTGIAPLPPMWGDKPSPFLGEGMVLVLSGAVDTHNGSLSLFPKCMRQELHAVRAVIEAHSRSGKLQGQEDASACGYDLRKGGRGCDLRVLSAGRWTDYRIDRWD